MQPVCNGETGSGSLGCTNSPETGRPRRVSSHFHAWYNYWPYFLFNPISFPFFLASAIILFFKSTPWTLLFTMEMCVPECSPITGLYAAVLLMVFLMAADGRREPLALGLGVERSFNKSQSVLCHYINIFGQLL